MVTPRAIEEARQRKLKETQFQSKQQIVQDLEKQRREQRSSIQKSKTKSIIKNQKEDLINNINTLSNKINILKDDFNSALKRGDRKRSGSRARKLLNERVTDRQEQIRVLKLGLTELDKGNTLDLERLKDQSKSSGKAVREVLKRQRFKSAGLTPGTATQKTTVRIKDAVKKDSKPKPVASFEKPEVLAKAKLKQQLKKKQVIVPKPLKVLGQNLNTSEEKLFNKVNTGQSLTPTEIDQFNSIVQEKGDKLNKDQLTLLKNAPKNIITGIAEVIKEIILIPPKVIKASFDFGKNLKVRFENGENNPLFNDIKQLGTSTKDIATFVKNNPKESASIIGLAVIMGGGNLDASFQKNPVKTTTKAVTYLFPGTVIKGGVKTVGLGIKGAERGLQSKRLVQMNTQVKGLRDSITLKQNNQLDKLLGLLTKETNQLKRKDKLNSFINKVAKAQDIKLKKGKDISKKISELKTKTKVIPIGTKKTIVKGTKTQPKKPVKLIDLKKGTVKRVAKLPPPKVTTPRDTTKFFQIGDGTISRVTKAEFKKLTPQLPKAQPKKPIKLINLKDGKVTKVSRESKKLQSKDIFKGKKGQAQLFTGSPKQIKSQVVKEIEDLKDIVKSIKKSKKKPNKKVISSLKSKIERLKKFINSATANNIFRGLGLITLLDNLIKDVIGFDKLPKLEIKSDQKPIQKKIIKQEVTPAKKLKKGLKKAFKPVPKNAQQLKLSSKKVQKPKKKPIKKTQKKLKPKLKFNFDSKLPKGSRLAFDFRFRERKNAKKNFNPRTNKLVTKTSKKADPKNSTLKSAIKRIRQSTAQSMDLKIVGVTKKNDIPEPDLRGFRLSKVGTDTLRLVQINPIETPSEKAAFARARKKAPKPTQKKITPKKKQTPTNKKKSSKSKPKTTKKKNITKKKGKK